MPRLLLLRLPTAAAPYTLCSVQVRRAGGDAAVDGGRRDDPGEATAPGHQDLNCNPNGSSASWDTLRSQLEVGNFL